MSQSKGGTSLHYRQMASEGRLEVGRSRLICETVCAAGVECGGCAVSDRGPVAAHRGLPIPLRQLGNVLNGFGERWVGHGLAIKNQAAIEDAVGIVQFVQVAVGDHIAGYQGAPWQPGRSPLTQSGIAWMSRWI